LRHAHATELVNGGAAFPRSESASVTATSRPHSDTRSSPTSPLTPRCGRGGDRGGWARKRPRRASAVSLISTVYLEVRMPHSASAIVPLVVDHLTLLGKLFVQWSADGKTLP
jgi:hypothetical protein